MMVLQLDTRNGKLIDYWHVRYYEDRSLKEFNSYFLEKNKLYVICYNNSLQSDEVPKVYSFLIPSIY